MKKQEVNVILGSNNKIFDIYQKLHGINYKALITTKSSKLLTNKIPMEIDGNYYFKNCNILRIGGDKIDGDWCGGDVVEIEVRKVDFKEILK